MNKILKRILAVILTVIIIIWIATILIGGYFVRYALYRNGAGGKREIKNEQVKIEEKDGKKYIVAKDFKYKLVIVDDNTILDEEDNMNYRCLADLYKVDNKK